MTDSPLALSDEGLRDSEWGILETVRAYPGSAQRDLARLSQLSLGMTNVLLRKLAAKGFLKLRRINPRQIQYLISPAGLHELTKRTLNYVQTSLDRLQTYRERVAGLVAEARRRGYPGLCLAEAGMVAPFLEGACQEAGLAFVKGWSSEVPESWALVCLSEATLPETQRDPKRVFKLADYLL